MSINNDNPKNKIGFNLLLWASSVSEKMKPLTERLKETGYDGVEVSMGEINPQPYLAFGKFLESINMEVTTVLAMGKDENPASSVPAIRNKSLEKLKWSVDRANELGAKMICGPVHSAFSMFTRQPPSEDEYKWSADVLHQAGEYAAKSDVIFAVEAINRFECYLCNTTTQLNKLVTLADHPNIRSMFDTHHANIEDKNLHNAIKILNDSLAHVHISENDRGTPGDGHIDWDIIFSTLASMNYSGWFTIEAFSRYDIEFANSINVWREYSEPWDIAVKGFAFIKKMLYKYNL